MVRLAKPGENNWFIRPPQVDARGHFLMEGVPAGVYDLLAWVIGGNRQQRPLKRTVSLTDGVVTDIAITMDLGGSPTPTP
jgi:hypothetical protein